MKTKAKQLTREQRDLKMMQTPDEWPYWPLLPVKKYNQAQHTYDCALLFADGKPTVIHAPLYRFDEVPGHTYAEKFADLKKEEFPNFEALVAAGWRVD